MRKSKRPMTNVHNSAAISKPPTFSILITPTPVHEKHTPRKAGKIKRLDDISKNGDGQLSLSWYPKNKIETFIPTSVLPPLFKPQIII
jgi:hypothetical protein